MISGSEGGGPRKTGTAARDLSTLGNFAENCPLFFEMGTMIPTSRSDWGLNVMMYVKC